MIDSPRKRGLLLATLGALALFFGWVSYQTAGVRTPALEVFGQVPAFTLTERSGATLKSSDLEGHVWVANFIFTRCAGPCPILSAKMSRLQTELADAPEVRLVSFSVDPLADTPVALEAYARKYQADPARWLFLTGEVETLYTLVEQGFRLPVGPMPPKDRIAPGDLITHTSRFVVVDAQGRVRGYYNSEEPEFHGQVLRAVRALRAEAGPAGS